MNQLTISLGWLFGFLLSMWMLRAEHEAEKKEYTYGDLAASVLLSLLSIAMVLFILIKAWTNSVHAYWGKPMRAKEKPKTKKAE